MEDFFVREERKREKNASSIFFAVRHVVMKEEWGIFIYEFINLPREREN